MGTYTKELSPVQQKEQGDLFEKVAPPPKVPPRSTRSQKAQAVKSGGKGFLFSLFLFLFSFLPTSAATIDLSSLIEATNVLKGINGKWYDAFEKGKWKEKVDMLEELIKTCEAPVLEKGDYSDLINSTRKVTIPKIISFSLF